MRVLIAGTSVEQQDVYLKLETFGKGVVVRLVRSDGAPYTSGAILDIRPGTNGKLLVARQGGVFVPELAAVLDLDSGRIKVE